MAVGVGKFAPTSRQEAEESRSLILYVGNFAAGTPLKTTMPILMDQVLTEYADQAYETARLGRTGVQTTRDRLLAEILADLEASGEAMRYVTSRGRIAWKATPQLPDYLTDLQLDAEADLEDI